jgi:hypothetical protein
MTNFRSALSLALLGCAAIAPAARAITLPSETAIPVMFTHTVDAKKAKAGDVVTAKTMQVVLLPNGEQIPKGTLVTGHVVEARPFNFDGTHYAVQQPSYLSIQFDRVADSQTAVAVRALASNVAVQATFSPEGIDEPYGMGTMPLVGGAHYSPVEGHVTVGPYDDIVGYRKKQGIFARLLPGGEGCEGTQTEQSVAIFSPSACGLYGFFDYRLTVKDSAFRVASTHTTVILRSGSAALLQVQ